MFLVEDAEWDIWEEVSSGHTPGGDQKFHSDIYLNLSYLQGSPLDPTAEFPDTSGAYQSLSSCNHCYFHIEKPFGKFYKFEVLSHLNELDLSGISLTE